MYLKTYNFCDYNFITFVVVTFWLLHLWLTVLLHLWLNFITFVVVITFVVNFITFVVSITFVGVYYICGRYSTDPEITKKLIWSGGQKANLVKGMSTSIGHTFTNYYI